MIQNFHFSPPFSEETNIRDTKRIKENVPRLRHWSGACKSNAENGSCRAAAGYRCGSLWRRPWQIGEARRAHCESLYERTRKSESATSSPSHSNKLSMKTTKKNRPCSLNSAVPPLPPASPSNRLSLSKTFSVNFSL
jgi:hypothetical protein